MVQSLNAVLWQAVSDPTMRHCNVIQPEALQYAMQHTWNDLHVGLIVFMTLSRDT